MATSYATDTLKAGLTQLGDDARHLAEELVKCRKSIVDSKASYGEPEVDRLVGEARSVDRATGALIERLDARGAVTADIVRDSRALYARSATLARNANEVALALKAASKEASAIKEAAQPIFETVAKLAVDLDQASDAAGPLEIIAEVKRLRETYETVEGRRDTYERVNRDEFKNTLGDIADHIASFGAPAATPMARPGTALIPSQPQRAEDALQQLLGTALVPRGKPPTAEFATALSAALDQRVAIDGRNVRILQPGLAVSIGGSEQPRGRQASLMRDIETESRAFLAIVNELQSIRRNVDTVAVADHRKRIARYVEELGATIRFPGGPLVDRARFQVDGIEREWSALKGELGVPGTAELNRSLAEAENEEVGSEAARGDANLARIHEALDRWTGMREGSEGARIARLMQQVRALEENTRQLEHAFDHAELGRSDRLSRRFLTADGGKVPVQALLDWLADDSRGWAADLAKGDARASVRATIIEGAERQRKLLVQLTDNIPSLVTVGHARVRRAVNEVAQNLDAIADEAGRLYETAAAS